MALSIELSDLVHTRQALDQVSYDPNQGYLETLVAPNGSICLVEVTKFTQHRPMSLRRRALNGPGYLTSDWAPFLNGHE